MTIIRRVVFGEPKPGGAQFAAALNGLAESVSFENFIDIDSYDRVTDCPPLLRSLVHQAPLTKVSAPPLPNDPYGVFACHHIELYRHGVFAATENPLHRRCVELCQAIYLKDGEPREDWTIQETAGVVWAVKVEDGRAYVVFRGSQSLLDWLRDLTAFDPDGVDAHPAWGHMWAGFMIGMADTWAVIRPQLAQAAEIIFTGHSLGADRADIAAAYALAP